MKQLEKEVQLRGTGIPGLSATLVKRKGNVCMYRRWDSVWEVFTPNIVKKGSMVFEKLYDDDTEVYVGTSDFGSTAWCFPDRKGAEKCYQGLIRAQAVKAEISLRV
jgi:hypothetical protein